ncbi:MAG: dephospho-CoA kinase [Xanthomonadaceae bacterium]|jgi:dephospho-CoA kinase|nr:dephospho-CoA kinase [Xanthomonadaceae bacterium]
MSDFIVGLTGGIASGKSEATRRFEALGIHIADADLIARQVVAPGQPALEKIVALFGTQVLQADGHLDRRRVRERVFADADSRHALESVTHPAIRQTLERVCRAAPGDYAIASIPLLTEAGGRKGYPWLARILVIDVPVSVQRARLIRRDEITHALAEQMIQAQSAREQRLAIADDILRNDGAPEHLDRQVLELDARYRVLARVNPA